MGKKPEAVGRTFSDSEGTGPPVAREAFTMTGTDPAVAGGACTVAGNGNAVTCRTFTVAGHEPEVAGMSEQPICPQRAHVHWISDPSVT